MSKNQNNITIQPHNQEAEQSVIGSILLKQDILPEIIDILDTEDFYFSAHREIFKACIDLFEDGNPVDLLTVRAKLKDNGKLEDVGGSLYLATLAETTVSTTRADYNATLIRDKSQIRKLINACTDIVNKSFSPSITTDEIMEDVDNHLRTLVDIYGERLNNAHPDLGKQFQKFLEGLKAGKNTKPLQSPWDEVNRVLKGGILPGEYAVLAARPSAGKSAAALNWLWSVVCSGKKTVLFSLEMTTQQIFNRLMANVANIDAGAFRLGLKPSQIKDIEACTDFVINTPLVICDSPRMTLNKIRKFLKKEEKEGKIDFVVIDYLQLLTADHHNQNREREVADMSRSVKLLAKEFNIPILLLAQLNRKVEENKREPIMSDLRESGSIEQDADIIMFLHAPKQEGQAADQIKLIVAKGRDSGTGVAYLTFDRPHQRLNGSTDLVYRQQIEDLSRFNEELE